MRSDLAQCGLHALKVLLLVEVGRDELGNERLDHICQCEEEDAHQGLRSAAMTIQFPSLLPNAWP